MVQVLGLIQMLVAFLADVWSIWVALGTLANMLQVVVPSLTLSTSAMKTRFFMDRVVMPAEVLVRGKTTQTALSQTLVMFGSRPFEPRGITTSR